MGFLNKAFRKVKKQIQPDNMFARDMGPGNMPRRSGNFGFGLREAIRRLQEQRGGDMGMPRMPRIDDGRMRAMPVGPGDRLQRPNFGSEMEQMPISLGDRMIGKPQPIPERMPTDPSSYYNPTIFGQQMGDMDFSQMPKISPVDMSNLQMPTLPREISQMDLPQMPEGLPSMQDVQGGRDLQQDFPTQRRMMMAGGDEVFMPSNPNQIAFSIESEIKVLMNEYEMAANNGEIERAQMVAEQINELEARKIQAMNEAKTMENLENENFEGSTLSDITIQEMLRNKTKMMYGGEMKGYANGGEIENMLSGMDSGEQEAMGELEQMAPEMEMIDQLVMMVAQMIQQGAGEEQVISFLREQGLDDEDIGTVLQLVAEMAETEEVAAQNEIGADLEQLG